MRRYLFLILLSLLLLCSCSRQPRYVIGVSQCSNDGWRKKVNKEMLIGQYQYDDVDIRFASADNDGARQSRQIDSMVAAGISLLVVAPSDVATVTPAVDRAYRKGIPVILYDRRTSSSCYTAYIGCNNEEMGRLIGQYVAGRLGGKGRVLELTGIHGSSPVEERHRGFMSVMGRYPDIRVTSVDGEWKTERAQQIVGRLLDQGQSFDCVFGHNDAEAIGAYRAARQRGKQGEMEFVGIDGLPGPHEGIDGVRQGMLTASYVYPTHGEEVIALAMNILRHRPYRRVNHLRSFFVTRDNVEIVTLQNDELERQSANLEQIYSTIDGYVSQLHTHRTIIVLSIIIIVLLAGFLAAAYGVYRMREANNRRQREMAEARMAFFTRAGHALRTPLTLILGPLERLVASGRIKGEDRETLSLLSRSTETLRSLVDDIMEASEKEPPTDSSGSDPFVCDDTASTLLAAKRMVVTSVQAGDDSRPIALVVDDTEDLRAYLRMVLAPHYQVLEAPEGRAGLALAIEHVPDIVVSDVMMPVMDGLELCRQLKEGSATSHIPVVLLTARVREAQQIEGYAVGADSYLTKPFSEKVLLATMENLLKNRARLKQVVEKQIAKGSVDAVEPGMSRDDEFIRKLRQAIQEHMGNTHLKMDDLADKVGLGRVQLYRKVKALTGTTPVDLLREARLARAHRLLQTTHMTISEVAYAVGFATPSYFTTCFKEKYGQYPNDVRSV